MCFKSLFLTDATSNYSAPVSQQSQQYVSTDAMSGTPFFDSCSYYGEYADPQVNDLLNSFDFPPVPSTPAADQSTSPMSFSSDYAGSPPNFHDPYFQRFAAPIRPKSSRPTSFGNGRPVYNGFTSPPEYAYQRGQQLPPNGHLPSFLQIMQGLDYSPGSNGEMDIKGFAVPPSTLANSPLQQQSLCKVCGDVASGNHFGVLSCEACKSFFRRSVRAGARYACRGSRSCTIEKHTRNRCQYCRLQKCMQTGMRKEGEFLYIKSPKLDSIFISCPRRKSSSCLQDSKSWHSNTTRIQSQLFYGPHTSLTDALQLS